MAKVLRKLYGPVLGFIIDGKKGFLQGLTNIATAYFGGPVAVGLSVLGALGKTGNKSKSNADKSRLYSTLNPNDPRVMAFGTTALGNDIRDEEYTGAGQEYFNRFVVCAAHKIDSFASIYFDDKLAWTSAGGVQGEYVGYLDVETRTEGSAANAINISSRMGASRRFTGLAYVHFRFKLTGNSKKAESPFANAIPSRVTIIGNAIPCYDPRQDSTQIGGSGSHRADNQATWTWGIHARNPACQAITYLLGWKINGLGSVGKGIPPKHIDMQSFMTAANVCDEVVPITAGGTEPRYRSDGVVDDSDQMGTVLGLFEDACDATFNDPQGRVMMRCRVNDLGAPVAHFTANDILGPVEWTPFADITEQYNIVRGSYTNATPASLYQASEYSEITSPPIAGINRTFTLDLPLVQSPSQAHRLAMRQHRRFLYAGGSLSADMQATAWRVFQDAPCTLDFAPLGFAAKPFRVDAIAVRVDGTVPITLVAEDDRIYDAMPDVAPPPLIATTPYNYLNNPLSQGIYESSVGPSIAASYTSGLSGNITQADNGAGAVTLTLPAHTRIYPAPFASASVNGGSLTLAYSEFALIYYDDETLSGGAVTFGKTAVAANGYFSQTNPYRHFVAYITAQDAAGAGGGTGGSSPPGGGGWQGGGGGGQIP